MPRWGSFSSPVDTCVVVCSVLRLSKSARSVGNGFLAPCAPLFLRIIQHCFAVYKAITILCYTCINRYKLNSVLKWITRIKGNTHFNKSDCFIIVSWCSSRIRKIPFYLYMISFNFAFQFYNSSTIFCDTILFLKNYDALS